MAAGGPGSPQTPGPGALHVTSRHQLPPRVPSDGSFRNQGKKKRKKSPLPNEITGVVQSHGPTGTCLVIQQEAKQRMEARWETSSGIQRVTGAAPSPLALPGCAQGAQAAWHHLLTTILKNSHFVPACRKVRHAQRRTATGFARHRHKGC